MPMLDRRLWFTKVISAAALLLLATIAAANAAETPLQIDVYVTVQPSPDDNLAQAFFGNNAVAIPLDKFGADGTAAFDAKFPGADGLKKEIDAAFENANKKFKDADVKFVVRKIIFIRADQKDIKPYYEAEHDVFDLKREEKTSLVQAFANATSATKDAFRMLIAPLTDDGAERGLAQDGGFVSVIGNDRAFESRDNGFILIHELAHNLGVTKHGGDGLTHAMSGTAPARSGPKQNIQADPKLEADEIGTIKERVSKGVYDAALTPDEKAKRKKAADDGRASIDIPSTNGEFASVPVNGGSGIANGASGPPLFAQTPVNGLFVSPVNGVNSQPAPASSFLVIEGGLCGGSPAPQFVGTQTVAGNTRTVTVDGQGGDSVACFGGGFQAAFGPPGQQTRVGGDFHFINNSGSQTVFFQRDIFTGDPRDSAVTFEQGNTTSAGIKFEQELGAFPCNGQPCTFGVAGGAGLTFQDVELMSRFDQTCCGGGVTHLRQSDTHIDPYLRAGGFVSLPLSDGTLIDISLVGSFSPERDISVIGVDGFDQPISDRVRIPADGQIMLTTSIRLPADGLFVDSDRAVFVSDRRLKRDVVLLAPLGRGISLYSYRYVGSSQRYVGVMAQEVMRPLPDAVLRSDDGYYLVDYARLVADPEIAAVLGARLRQIGL